MNMNPLSVSSLSICFALNIISFLVYGADKAKAKLKWWRIPEKYLLLIALIAPIGALAGMQVFRHKIRKTRFKYLVPFFVAVHLVLLAVL
ncbi:MAG: DUF1294 domain-containing protein [Methanosarcinaceae archaeon]